MNRRKRPGLKMSKKNILRIVVNTAIGVVLVVVWLQFVNLEEISCLACITN